MCPVALLGLGVSEFAGEWGWCVVIMADDNDQAYALPIRVSFFQYQ
jgi:hypothetical protein